MLQLIALRGQRRTAKTRSRAYVTSKVQRDASSRNPRR